VTSPKSVSLLRSRFLGCHAKDGCGGGQKSVCLGGFCKSQSVSFSCVTAISFPESSFPLTSGRKTRVLGATISGMHHRCRVRSETGWAESPEFGYFKMVAPRALVFRPLVKRNEDSGNEIGVTGTVPLLKSIKSTRGGGEHMVHTQYTHSTESGIHKSEKTGSSNMRKLRCVALTCKN